MKNYSYKCVDLNGGYLFDKQNLNRKITLDAVYDRFNETGRFKAFDFDYKEGDEIKPHIFWDSDVAKWIESASYILNKYPNPEIEKRVEEIIDKIEAHQEKNGYFNVYFTVCEPDKRFTLRTEHELYCAGHLIEAAVAYAEATGRERFLHLMEKYALHIKSVFMDKEEGTETAKFETPGHQEIELALIRLYNYTQNKAYLDLAKYFIDIRGVVDEPIRGEHNQSHLPIREQKEAIGHAVRALYMYSGMASLALETDEKELKDICIKLFDEIAAEKTYITGAFGATRYGEAFGPAYALPNDTAYAETCASIAMIFFAKRMLELDTNTKYADMIELALYNGVLSGISLDGKSFFYENPLEISSQKRFEVTMPNGAFPEPWGGNRIFPITQRVEVFYCSCCPPNISRLLGSLGDYIYAKGENTLFVNQYVSSSLEKDGVNVQMITDYPISGGVKLVASGVDSIAFRIPAWCDSFSINKSYILKNGYAVITNDGSEILLNLNMQVRKIYADPRVLYNVGKVAIMRGPIVYCAESVDNGAELDKFVLENELEYTVIPSEEFTIPTLEIKAKRRENLTSLYSAVPPKKVDTMLKMIPYNSFANRGESDMLVWVNANY